MAETGADRAALQRRTLRVLVTGQVLGGAAIGVAAAVAPLLAKDILGDDTFAGMPFAAFAFGAAFAAVPLSRVMARHGRRRGLTAGYLVAGAGSASAVVAAEADAFPLLLLGMLLFGAGSASNLLARYAGADLALPTERARAISTVVWATTLGAVAGPNVIGPAGRLGTGLDLPALAGPYVAATVLFLMGAVVFSALMRPDPMAAAGLLSRDGDDGAPAAPSRSVPAVLRDIAARPAAAAGLATMAVAHGVMVSVMTMTPLHLRNHGDSLEVVGVVISLHIAGMYALAPVVGLVADRVGSLRVTHGAAVALAMAAGLAAAAGHNHLLIGTALTLLGLAWSMATIGGAALLVTATPPAERVRVQGVADMTMGVMGGVGGTVSGIVVGTVGYGPLSAVGAVIAAALLVILVRSGARLSAPAPA